MSRSPLRLPTSVFLSRFTKYHSNTSPLHLAFPGLSLLAVTPWLQSPRPVAHYTVLLLTWLYIVLGAI